MKDKNKKLLKKIVIEYNKKKQKKINNLTDIFRKISHIESLMFRYVIDNKVEFKYLNRIYFGILKNEEDEYYTYYRCGYYNKIYLKEKIENTEKVYTLYYRMYDKEKVCINK